MEARKSANAHVGKRHRRCKPSRKTLICLRRRVYQRLTKLQPPRLVRILVQDAQGQKRRQQEREWMYQKCCERRLLQDRAWILGYMGLMVAQRWRPSRGERTIVGARI